MCLKKCDKQIGQRLSEKVTPTFLCVQAKGKSGPTILDGVHMVASAGEVTAVVGPSGSGKSTLLDALGGRIRPSSLGGTFWLTGSPVDAAGFRSICAAYVPQVGMGTSVPLPDLKHPLPAL